MDASEVEKLTTLLAKAHLLPSFLEEKVIYDFMVCLKSLLAFRSVWD